MSYNCHAEYLGDGRLRIKTADFDELSELDGLAEVNFLTEAGCTSSAAPPGEVAITKLWWYGECSGSGFDILKEKILPRTLGVADILFTWERGDSFSGLRVEDGKVTECEAIFTLKPIVKKAA